MTEVVARAPGTGMRSLTVISGPRRYDVVIDEHLLVEEVLDLVLPGSDLLAMTMAGEPLPLDRTIIDSGLETGSMILTTSARVAVTPPRVRSAAARLTGEETPGGTTALGNAGSRSVLVAVSSGDIAPTGGSSRSHCWARHPRRPSGPARRPAGGPSGSRRHPDDGG